MRLHDLKPAPGAVRPRKRVGRGPSSGHGKTSGRGTKGQNSRENVRPGFEGGQTPLHRRLPKRRGSSKGSMPIGMLRPRYIEVNVGQLERLEPGTEVTVELLKERRIVRKTGDGLRVLGGGELTKPLTVKASHFTASARAKIEAAGGTAEVV